MIDISQARATFVDESRELLAQMEEILLRAEGGEIDLLRAFRAS